MKDEGRRSKFQTYLDNAGEGTSCRLQDVLHSLTADSGLLGNGTLDQISLGIRWDLSTHEDVGACLDGLGLLVVK